MRNVVLPTLALWLAIGVAAHAQFPLASQSDWQDCRQDVSFDKKIAACSRVLAQSTGMGSEEQAIAYFNRGYGYMSFDQFPNAIKDYTDAIKLRPNYALAYRARGIAYRTTKDFDLAIADFNSAAKINPRDWLAYDQLAITYAQIADTVRMQASRDTEQPIAVSPPPSQNLQPPTTQRGGRCIYAAGQTYC